MAVVNGKPITVYDLAKKLDVTFYKQYPQYADSIETKFQFYQYHWKFTLRDMIDKELIISDAKEVKLPVSPGDVRQEMETLFGPNIISNLDRIGLSYEDAQEVVESDLLLQRMLSMRVNLKSMRKVTPLAIRQAYEEYCKVNQRQSEWDYRVVSIQHSDSAKGAEIAGIVGQLLEVENVSFDEVKERVKAMGLYDEDTKINITPIIHNTEKDIAEFNKISLTGMKADTYSKPLDRASPDGKSRIFKIFYLEKLVQGGNVPFEEVENKLLDQIRSKVMDDETESYLKRLYEHFHFDEKEMTPFISSDFEPFSLH